MSKAVASSLTPNTALAVAAFNGVFPVEVDIALAVAAFNGVFPVEVDIALAVAAFNEVFPVGVDMIQILIVSAPPTALLAEHLLTCSEVKLGSTAARERFHPVLAT
jgi:hypothetical protein